MKMGVRKHLALILSIAMIFESQAVTVSATSADGGLYDVVSEAAIEEGEDALEPQTEPEEDGEKLRKMGQWLKMRLRRQNPR